MRGACAIALVSVLAFALSTFGNLPSAGAQLSLGHLKSLWIERFTRFIEWPAHALPKEGPFVLCIQGAGDTANDLARVAPTRRFKDRRCEVRRLRPGTDLSACHLVFLAGTEVARLPEVLPAVASKPILTVSDTPGFAERGILINLFVLQDRQEDFLRFEINLAEVKKSKLVFSSQLLRLAQPVGQGVSR